MRNHCGSTILLSLLFFSCALSQTTRQIGSDEALRIVEQKSSLTRGGVPFHAVLTIAGPSPVYSGTIELFWLAPEQYRLQMTTHDFRQRRTVDHEREDETNEGEYLPRWLEDFRDALLDPESMAANFRGLNLSMALDGNAQQCLRRDDRHNGITDQLTWGILCFTGTEPRLESILSFNRSMEFTDYGPFGRQQVARTYSTSVLDYKQVVGHLTILETIDNPDPALVSVTKPTAPGERIRTTLVSTLEGESLMEHAPAFHWPTVREGKTDGYMIVYARTDRTGQVRETAKHNSDQPGLEQFGREQALTLKFKPLVVDGIARQMEMPLVLHFSTTKADQIPILNDAQIRTQMSGCTLPQAKADKRPFRVRVSVDESGKLTGETYLDANIADAPHAPSTAFSLRNCTFAPYLVNGKPTYYHGDLLLP